MYTTLLGRGDDTVGNPRRAQTSQFEFVELTILLQVDKRFPVEQFEATVSQSTVPSPTLTSGEEEREQCGPGTSGGSKVACRLLLRRPFPRSTLRKPAPMVCCRDTWWSAALWHEL